MTKLNSQSTLFAGHIFDVVAREYESAEQGKFFREVVELKNDAIAVAMIDKNTQQVYVNNEFRAGINQTIDSIPAGKIDADESKEHALRREVLEETGFVLDDTAEIIELATVNSSEGFTNEKVTVYAVIADFSNMTQADTDFDADEYVTGNFVDLTEWRTNTLATPHSAPAVVAAMWSQIKFN